MARQVCEDQKSSGGFCYGDVSTSMQAHLANQIQGFVSDPDMFNLTNGMEMIGFPKNLPQHTTDNMWKTFIPKPPQQTPPSSKTINDSSTNYYHHHNYTNKPPTDFSSETSGENNLIVQGLHDSATWQVDDSSLRCIFPCEGDQRPSQGLSLSLSSNNPSSIGLQSFDLRQHQQNDFASSSSRTSSQQQQQQILLQDSYFMLKNSKYMIPAQDLLNEFVNLGINESQVPKQQKSQINGDGSGSSNSKNSPTCLEFVELQKRKTKLLSMLEEVDRRYKHYRNQMKAVVASFEAVAGKGAAKVYSALALRAMSRHFRCLKDGILAQMEATRKAMGERDTAAPGTTRGETPRLKAIDQALRQQRAFQQMSMMETHPWRPQRGLPERSVSVLRAWLFEHFLHPYPSDVDKHILSRQTGLTRSQVSNWFINARVRLWKPMVEEMYLEEVKERENNNIAASSDGGTDQDDDIIQNQPSSSDQKPTPEHLTRMESECASSIMKNNTKGTTTLHMMNPQVTDAFGSVELDFATYAQHSSGMVSYGSNEENGNNNNQQSMNNNGGVSLTLGLQQHGVSLAFPPPSHQSSLLYQTRDQMETVQYSLLDGEGQNLPYRNLMGAQLLHDLAG